MKKPMTSKDVKKKFGELFRAKRSHLRVSRERLARTVGISPNTIKNWETGKTFVEDLGVIVPIVNAFEIYIPAVLDEAVRSLTPTDPVA